MEKKYELKHHNILTKQKQSTMRKEEHNCLDEIAHKVTRYMKWDEYKDPADYEFDDILLVARQLTDDLDIIHGCAGEANTDMLFEHGFCDLLRQDNPCEMLYPISRAIKAIEKLSGREVSGTLYRLTLKTLYDFKELKEAFHGGQLIDIRPNTLVWMDGTVVCCIRDISAAQATDYNKGGEFSAEMNGDTYYAGSIDEIIIKFYAECGDTVSKVKYKYKH